MPDFVKDNVLDHAALAAELAKAIPGAEYVADPEYKGPYSLPRIRLANGVMVTLRPNHKRVTGVSLSAYHMDNNKVSERIAFPEINVDISRQWDALVRDIMRRLVAECEEPARKLAAAIRAKNDRKAELQAVMAEYQKACPMLKLTEREGGEYADVYLNLTDKGYLTGSLYEDGHLSLQRVSVTGKARGIALVSLIASDMGA